MPSHAPSPTSSSSPTSSPPSGLGASEIQPLSATHPQLSILSTPLTSDPDGPIHVEYRVYNYRRLPSGRVNRGDGWGLMDFLWGVGLIWLPRKGFNLDWALEGCSKRLVQHAVNNLYEIQEAKLIDRSRCRFALWQ